MLCVVQRTKSTRRNNQSIGVAELVVGSADANARGKGLRTDEYDVMTDAPRFGSDAFRSDVTTHADALVRDFDDATRAQVLKQFEFYFCDSNLPRDNFLLEEVHESTKAGRGGAVYISLIAGFSRMRELLKPYGGKENPRNVEAIAKALEPSELLEVVDGNAVKRRDLGVSADIDLGTEDGMNAYREAKVAELDKRFVYVSPFARDTSIEQVQEYFS